MKYYMISFSSQCKMFTLEENSKVHEIKSEARPSLSIQGLFFPSRIRIEGREVLRPGDSAVIEVEAIIDESSKELFYLDGFLSFGDGPVNILIQGYIISKPILSPLD